MGRIMEAMRPMRRMEMRQYGAISRRDAGRYKGVVRLKVKYIGPDSVGMPYGTIEDVITIEKGWYRVMSALDESYLFPPNVFEILEGSEDDVPHYEHGPYHYEK